MQSNNVMQKSLVRGVILSVLLVAVLVVIQPIEDVSAQQKKVTAKSISFEETSIIEFENEGNSEASMFRLWLSNDVSFKSFKTEQGWTGTKTPEGVLVFVTTEPVKSGESVKFGIKTDKAKPGINWKVLDKNNVQIETGKTLSTESSGFEGQTKAASEGSGVLTKSVFRIIPEKPNVGSTIRITGEGFGTNHELSFFIDNKKLETFQSDDDGFFIITSKIPRNLDADRVNFSIKDKDGNVKDLSLRLGEELGRMASTDEVPLTMKGLSDVLKRGDLVSLSGTAGPGRSVTATIKDPTNKIITTNATQVDSNGKWSYQTSIPIDSPLGLYKAEITDGKQTITKSWTVKSSKTINIEPIKLKFNSGETLQFNGTATPNEKLELTLENPQGIEVFTEVLEIGDDGAVEFEHKTDVSYLEGTYVLYATQKEVTEIILVGLGELPEEQVIVKVDKLNYKDGETALITIDGPQDASLDLIVVDPSDKNKFSDTITLDPDGTKVYELKISGYSTGIYTIVAKRGNSQDSQVFSVGLQTGASPIDIKTTKDTYNPGDSILLLGTSGKNILIKLTLIDPNGNAVKSIDSFTNKEGHLSDSTFRVPVNAKTGTWTINAKSGSNFDNVEFSVHTAVSEGISVFVDSVEDSYQGDLITIKGFGAAPSKTIFVKIVSPTDEEVTDLTVVSTGSGEFSTIWLIPQDLSPGVYTIEVDDRTNQADTTFTIEE